MSICWYCVLSHFCRCVIFAGYVSFMLLRFVFSFVCACLDIISCLRLVLCVFRCVINFFLFTYQCQLVILCFATSLQVPIFAGWMSFCGCCFVFAFDRSTAWPIAGLGSCSVCFFLVFHFFRQNESEHDVPGNFPATRDPKSCMPTPPTCTVYLFLMLSYAIAPMRIHTHP